jgi:hypothetical protein
LEAVCSSAAYWTNGTKSRLLTAGHCAALTSKSNAKIAISKDGLTFYEAKVIASGWRDESKKDGSYSVSPNLPRISPRDSLVDGIDTTGGDWAILEVKTVLPVLPLSRTPVKRGDFVYDIGFPIGGDSVAAWGIVANVAYGGTGTPWDGYIATNLPAMPGSSGTPVVNIRGEVVGILVAGAGDNLHLLTPIALVLEKLPCLMDEECPIKEKK